MKKTLRVLNIEDSERDVELLLRHLSRSGYEVIFDRVETSAEMRAALEREEWDVILCDYSMPQFSALGALALLKGMGLDIPFIIISGTVGEVLAVEAMRAGAHDYLMKDNLARLGPVIEREMEEAKTRQARREDEEEKKRLIAQIESQRKRLDNIVANVPGVFWESWGEPGAETQRATFVSEYIEELLGYSVAEWVSTPNFWLSIIHPDDRERIARAAATFASGKSSALEFRWIAKDGRAVWVESRSAVITDDDGWPVGLRGVTIDISERKRVEEALRKSEEQLQHAQKMEAIGRLAGGIAHDFNNLLTAIIGYTQIIQSRLHPESEFHKEIEEILKAGRRAASLTGQLLAFSRKHIVQLKNLNLNFIVSDLEMILRRLIGEDIDLKTALDPEIGSVKADSSQIEQVIVNLVVNARDAMPQGGKLTIETASIFLKEECPPGQIPLVPGSYAMLTVSDIGTGMDAETQAHLFEPFFTTKGPGKGTGLGLSTVYGIVKHSGGYIRVCSEPGEGTTFNIYLPRTSEEAEAINQSNETEESLRGTESILLIEDDEMVRNLVKEVLRCNGYEVLDATDEECAIAICKSHQGPVHLLLTDKIMPGTSGREMANRLKQHRPEMKVLYISGSADAINHPGILDSDIPYLQKPFTPNMLARKLREVIETGK